MISKIGLGESIMNESIVAAIVIYNKKIENSITYNHIASFCYHNVHILIVDNSEVETGNKAYCQANGICYISMGKNAGLSKAYNRIIEWSQDKDVIVLLDDDTEITSEFFEILFDALENNPEVDIFAPIIYGQDGVIYSPNEYGFLKNHLISNEKDNINPLRFNAISSGLAIRMDVFDGYRFDERLFVDQVDQHFCYEQRKRGKRFLKLNVAILQHFYQREAILTPEAGWKRLRLRITDIMQQSRMMGGGKYILYALIKCCGLGIQIGRKSKSGLVMMKACMLSFKLLFCME